MKNILFLIVLSLSILTINAQTVEVEVDVSANKVNISPYIYGLNYDPEGEFPSFVKSIRLGGNRWSGYNWENNASNAGKDYIHSSDNFLVGGVTKKLDPAYAITSVVNRAKVNRQFALSTLQLAGYVSADALGAVSEQDAAPSDRWKKVEVRKNSEFTLNPDLIDEAVYMDEFVNYLLYKVGSAQMGGINAYSLGNEPDYWLKTHPRIRNGNAATYTELITKAIDYGKMVKEIDSAALIFGPTVASWQNLKNLNLAPDRGLFSSYSWFVDAYLDSIGKVESVYGKKILDVFCFNYYPETKGGGSRIIWNKPSIDTAPSVNIARLQCPRSMWDSSYVEENTYSTGLPMLILPTLNKSIDTYAPGTKIAITEFEYGAEYHISGGLVLVDLLGVWGREGVYLTSKWHGFSQYSELAYKLYLDYDGEGSSYGSTAIKSVNSNDSLISTFASVDEQGLLHLMIVNKAEKAIDLNYHINNGYYSSAKVWGFENHSVEIKEYSRIETIADGQNFNYQIPARSALHFVCQKMDVISPVFVEINDLDNSSLTLKLSMDIDPTIDFNVLKNQISFIYKGNLIQIDSVKIKTGTEIVLFINKIFTSDDSDMQLIINNSAIKGINGLYNDKEYEIEVLNMLSGAAPQIINSEIDNIGKKITIVFSKELSELGSESSNIQALVNGYPIIIDSVSNASDSLIIFIQKRVVSSDNLSVNYSGNAIYSVDGGGILSFAININTYLAPPVSPKLDTLTISNYGKNLTLDFSKFLESESILNNEIKIYENDSLKSFYGVLDGKFFNIELDNRISYNSVIRVIYKDNGSVLSLDGGILDNVDYSLIYKTPETIVEAIQIPGKFESEEIYYANREDIELVVGSEISYTKNYEKGDQVAYNIDVAKEGDYTILFKTSGFGYGEIGILTETEYYKPLFLNPVFQVGTWQYSGVTMHLYEGIQNLRINVISPAFNLDDIEIIEGDFVPEILFQNGEVKKSGIDISLSFNRYWGILPNVSEITIKAGNGTDYSSYRSIPVLSCSNSKYMLKLVLSEPVKDGETVLASINSSTATSLEGGEFIAFNDQVLINKSDIPSGLKEDSIDVSISPNPSSNGKFVINSTSNKISEVRIYTNSGEKIFSLFDVCENNIIVDYSGCGINEGIYIVEIVLDNYKIISSILSVK